MWFMLFFLWPTAIFREHFDSAGHSGTYSNANTK
jgi:hypothetical protein